MTNKPAMTGAELALLCVEAFPTHIWKPDAAAALGYTQNYFYGFLSGRLPIPQKAAESIRLKLREILRSRIIYD
jgi:hypothetical protein